MSCARNIPQWLDTGYNHNNNTISSHCHLASVCIVLGLIIQSRDDITWFRTVIIRILCPRVCVTVIAFANSRNVAEIGTEWAFVRSNHSLHRPTDRPTFLLFTVQRHHHPQSYPGEQIPFHVTCSNISVSTGLLCITGNMTVLIHPLLERPDRKICNSKQWVCWWMSWKFMGGRLCPNGPAAAEVNYGPAQWVYYPPQMTENMRKFPYSHLRQFKSDPECVGSRHVNY